MNVKYIIDHLPFINSGHERSIKAKKNILLSLFVKGGSICITFLLVPLMIKYLNKSQYGVWVTIGSIVNWASLFDFGLGNGLRNKLAEAMAKSNKHLARIYISTTYALIAMIMGSVFIVFMVAQFFIKWSIVFNVPDIMESELSMVMKIILFFFTFQFVIRIIHNVLLADQNPGTVDLLRLISKIVSFFAILILINITRGSLTVVAIVFNVTPTIVMLIASIIFYNKRYRVFKPSFRYVKLKYAKDLLNLGIQFFIMQIAVIVMFSTDNIIVTQLFGPESVTTYDIAYKYFGVLTLFFSIIISPIWSATTEAYTKRDFNWIKKIVRKMLLIWLGLSLFAIVMVIMSNQVYRFWVGDDILIPVKLSIGMAVYVILFMLSNVFVSIINGTGKVRLQFYTAIIAAIINIPLSIFLGKYLHMGPSGVIFATSLSNFFGPIIAPIQYVKLIHNKAKGIWNK